MLNLFNVMSRYARNNQSVEGIWKNESVMAAYEKVCSHLSAMDDKQIRSHYTELKCQYGDFAPGNILTITSCLNADD